MKQIKNRIVKKISFSLKNRIRQEITNLGEFVNTNNCRPMENLYYFLCSVFY